MIRNFLKFYYKHLPISRIDDEPKKSFLNVHKQFSNLLEITPSKEESPYTHQIMSDVFNDPQGNYLWFLKPNGLNRGRGIKIFNKIEQLETFLNENLMEEDEILKKKEEDKIKNKLEINKKMERLTKSYQTLALNKKKAGNINKVFVIQKYIEKPLLINERKFDIRVWSLITQTLDFYFFKYLLIHLNRLEYRKIFFFIK